MATVIERSLRETLDGEPEADVSGRIAALLCADGRVPSAFVRTGAHTAKGTARLGWQPTATSM